MEDIPVIGKFPALSGRSIEAVVVESFVCAGELVASANVVYIQSAGHWHRLVLDAGTVHWREEEECPKPWSVPENQWVYPHLSLGEELGLSGACVSRTNVYREGSGICVEIALSNGRVLVVSNDHDSSSYRVA